MNKLKELWGKNKVLIVLGVILIICFIAIIIVTVSFFLGGSKSVYGNRLDDIDKYPITDTFKKEYINTLKENEKVDDVELDIRGRIIYVTIDFVGDTPLVDAQSIATGSVSSFAEDILGYYDLNFTIESVATDNSEGYYMLGARNATGSGGLVWSNNTIVSESEE